jgi:hypothetical protein
MAEDNIDKVLPNEPRKEFNIPGEEEIQEQVVEEVQAEQESLGPVDIQENEDGSVDINLDPALHLRKVGMSIMQTLQIFYRMMY